MTSEAAAGGLRAWRAGDLPKVALNRLAHGVLTIFLVSLLVFAATVVLPGNAARAVLGKGATPERLHALEVQLHLNRSLPEQYWSWLSGLFHGDFGTSLASNTSVSGLVGPRIVNSCVLMLFAGIIGTLLGLVLGVVAAARAGRAFDHISSVIALAVTALPEFVIAVALIAAFATLGLHVLPAVSVFDPSAGPLSNPSGLVLPVATLVIVIVPYVFRMTRSAMIEALASDYAEMARLKGMSRRRVLMVHALPNGIAPIAQVIGVNFLYLAGGVVVVEYVFNYPGVGATLVNAVADRDVPTIQFIVVILAAFYVFVNIATDMIALIATPRRRLPR
jgi:peptide/nickel transport system permease protein